MNAQAPTEFWPAAKMARRIDVAERIFQERVRRGDVKPDAITPGNRRVSLFSPSRIGELQRLFRKQPVLAN